jgi:hypothetical protein
VADVRPESTAPRQRAQPKTGPDISWTGLIGGIAASVGIGGLGVAVIAVGDAVELAVIMFAIAAVYIPAVYVSIVRTPARRGVLRATVVFSLLLAFTDFLLLRAGFIFLMLVPTTLLAIAAGLIFQRRSPEGK